MIAEKLKFNPQIEGLRAIAVLGVLMEHLLREHLTNPILKDLPYGKGVLLFFVISGYLITYQIFQFKEQNKLEGKSQGRSILKFFMRRILRIFPLYYALIAFLLIINFQDIKEVWFWLVTYNANFKMGLETRYMGSFTHLWSLAVEEKFYLIWIWFVLLIPPKRTFIIYLLIAGVSIAALNILKYKTSIPLAADFFTISCFFIFISGSLVAYFQFYHAEKFRNLNWKRMGWGILIFMLVLFPFYNRELYDPRLNFIYVSMKPLIAIFFGLVVAFAAASKFKGIFNWLLTNPVMLYLGKISYGLYAFHLFLGPLWMWMNKYLHLDIKPIPMFFVLVGLDVALASLTWYLLEKPFLRLKKRFVD